MKNYLIKKANKIIKINVQFVQKILSKNKKLMFLTNSQHKKFSIFLIILKNLSKNFKKP